MKREPVVILGAGPVGLALALLLARRHVPSRVFDARALDAARADRRVLALSRGSLQTLAALADLPHEQLAPIRTVVVSSAGQFGRAVIREDDVGGGQLGATIRYGDLLEPLAAAAAVEPLITIRRPLRIDCVRQRPVEVEIEAADGECISAPLAINAEGLGARNASALPATSAALVADVEVEGPAPGWAFERFTRDGPLALLPVAARAVPSAQPMALIWCMPAAAADRRHALSDADFLAEAQAQLGMRNRLRAVRARGRTLLAEQSRETLREHRVVYLGNAAQTLHPVAGQGLNLGLRDCVTLADCIGVSNAAGDPAERLADYERLRRADRAAILALTRTAPALFATRFTPVAIGRSLALTLLSIVPDLRREFARLLMFGVRF